VCIVYVYARVSMCACMLPPPLPVFVCFSFSSPICSPCVYVFRVFVLGYLCVCVYLYFPSSHPPISSVCMCYVCLFLIVCVCVCMLPPPPLSPSPLSLTLPPSLSLPTHVPTCHIHLPPSCIFPFLFHLHPAFVVLPTSPHST
jgi:hypothetical protein